jgi:hypothetical protein
MSYAERQRTFGQIFEQYSTNVSSQYFSRIQRSKMKNRWPKLRKRKKGKEDSMEKPFQK